MPRRVIQGMVVSDAADKTVTVQVERRVMHPLYKKYIRRHQRFTAHDAENGFHVGDVVDIRECRPISKHKSWEVIGKTATPAVGGSLTGVKEKNMPRAGTQDKAARDKAKAKSGKMDKGASAAAGNDGKKDGAKNDAANVGNDGKKDSAKNDMTKKDAAKGFMERGGPAKNDATKTKENPVDGKTKDGDQ